MKLQSPTTRFIWELEKNQFDLQIAHLSKSNIKLVQFFIIDPNENYLSAVKVASLENQDGTTERWKYYLRDNLFAIIEGYIPKPWSTTEDSHFHIAILQGVFLDE